jgi:hypothetical protein
MTFSGFSQVQISGQLDVVLRNPNAVDNSNKTFINFSNYDFYRTRIFLDAKPAENVTVFTQILVDNGEFNLYGAYIRLSFFEELLNFHLGLIPNTVGIWGPRTYSDKNPFIAVPLVYNYHTSYALKGLDPGEDIFTTTPDGIIALKGKGYLFRGLPVLYDACWNSGLEIFGSYKMFDWSLAAISGSASYPARQPARDLPQVTTRLTYFPIAHINVSLSGYYGPYLNDEIIDILNVETGTVKSVNDFINSGVGVSFVYSGEYFEIFSEAFHSAWDHPFLGDLTASSSYVDLSYKFAPQWFGGIRGEIMRFSEVEGSLGKTEWDYPLNRYELVIGHKINRNVILKLDTQFSQYPDKKSINDHIYAIQVSTTF